MLPQPQIRPPLALSVAAAAPPRSLLCIIDDELARTRDSEAHRCKSTVVNKLTL